MKQMEWFDLVSIATLFGVKVQTVRHWVRSRRLPAVRSPFSVFNPISGKRTSTRKLFVNRVHLEDFFIRRWHASGMTLRDLIMAKQATGDIKVWVTPEDEPQGAAISANANLVTLGAEVLYQTEALRARRLAGQVKPPPPNPIGKTRNRIPFTWRQPVQLELFS